jgi:hypothetical protein
MPGGLRAVKGIKAFLNCQAAARSAILLNDMSKRCR